MGTVTGVKAGSTRIVVTAGNVSASFDVSVSAVSSLRVWYRPDSSSVKGGAPVVQAGVGFVGLRGHGGGLRRVLFGVGAGWRVGFRQACG